MPRQKKTRAPRVGVALKSTAKMTRVRSISQTESSLSIVIVAPDVPSPDEVLLDRYNAWGGAGTGTLPEFIAYDWLVTRKRLTPNVDFVFQSSQFGGRQALGGAIVDFIFPLLFIVWRIQGERFHLLEAKNRAKDTVQRLQLLSYGYTVVDLWADDLLTRAEFVLQAAYEGREAGTAAFASLRA